MSPSAAAMRHRVCAPRPTSTPAPTRSGLEDDLADFLDRHGLPPRLHNTRVAGYEVDAFFPEQNLIIELDGLDFHSDRDAFERDRDRDANTLLAGLATVRATWERLIRSPGREAARLQAILSARS